MKQGRLKTENIYYYTGAKNRIPITKQTQYRIPSSDFLYLLFWSSYGYFCFHFDHFDQIILIIHTVNFDVSKAPLQWPKRRPQDLQPLPNENPGSAPAHPPYLCVSQIAADNGVWHCHHDREMICTLGMCSSMFTGREDTRWRANFIFTHINSASRVTARGQQWKAAGRP